MRREQKKRKLALFDIDKTLYDGYLLFPLLEQQRSESTISEKTYTAIQEIFAAHKRGDIDYETFARLLLIEWAAGLRGISVDFAVKQAVQLIDREFTRFYPYVASVMKLLWGSHDIYLVTGEPEFVADRVKTLYRADGVVATVFGTNSSQVFSGSVDRFLASKEEKLAALSPLLHSHDLSDSYAFGDSFSDADMLGLVENPICVNPSTELREIAERKNWTVATPDTVLPLMKQKVKIKG